MSQLACTRSQQLKSVDGRTHARALFRALLLATLLFACDSRETAPIQEDKADFDTLSKDDSATKLQETIGLYTNDRLTDSELSAILGRSHNTARAIATTLAEASDPEDQASLARMLALVSPPGDSTSSLALQSYFKDRIVPKPPWGPFSLDWWSPTPTPNADQTALAVERKLQSLQWIGMVGGTESARFLQQVLDHPEDVAAAWFDEADTNLQGGRAHTIASIEGKAAFGLAYIPTDQALDAAKKFFDDARAAASRSNTPEVEHRLNEAVSALAERALVEDIGLEERRLLLDDATEYFAKIAPHLEKYSDDAKTPPPR